MRFTYGRRAPALRRRASRSKSSVATPAPWRGFSSLPWRLCLAAGVSPGLARPLGRGLEGAAGGACSPAAGGALTGGGVVLGGPAADSPQGARGFLELRAGMGAGVAWAGADVEVRGARLRAVA